mgnify:CR=1 FL=1
MKHNKETFEYLGYHFTPEKRLTDNQLELKNVSLHQSSDKDLGFNTYTWKKHDYNYDEFYEAYGEKWFDLFRCKENGRLYIPGQNELFIYN